MFSVGITLNVTIAFLPSSFAMYMTMFAFSFALDRPSVRNSRRTLLATVSFAVGGLVGWPFTLALALPFVFEELFLFGADRVTPEVYQSWLFKRWTRLFFSGLCGLLVLVNIFQVLKYDSSFIDLTT